LLASFPVNGFLGTGAPFEADLNLIVQVIMAVALVAGSLLGKRKCYKAHGICQTTVLLVNLVMIGLIMWPKFEQQIEPRFPRVFHKRYYAITTIHALLGATAELFGIYIVMVAGTRILPERLQFKNWKRWMRAELMLWSAVLVTGVGTYYLWYIAPAR
jgi:uncharacterized membrane protein YozB (DUF420 family)